MNGGILHPFWARAAPGGRSRKLLCLPNAATPRGRSEQDTARAGWGTPTPRTCKEARGSGSQALGYSGARWDAVEELRTEWGPSGLDLAQGQGGKGEVRLVPPDRVFGWMVVGMSLVGVPLGTQRDFLREISSSVTEGLFGFVFCSAR